MRDRNRTDRSALDVNVDLLEGFGFSCIPGCGLCCFASPRLEGQDEARLRTVAPDARVVHEGAERRLAARPNGGACQFLSSLQCGVHAARPAPCREFPVSVHVGTRLQATVVLSCPGLRLDPLLVHGPSRSPLRGLEAELASVRERLAPSVARRLAESDRRRRRVRRALDDQGRWVDEEEVRRELANRRLIPGPEDFLPHDPPSAKDGLEFLPMYYDGRSGPVAMAEGLGGWEALELAPEGGSRVLGMTVPPDRLPDLDAPAEELLSGYLRYWLARDGFLAAVHLEMLSAADGNVVDAALSDLRAIGSDVIARGAARAKLRGRDGRSLTRDDVELGIRGTDQDWLDRPTWGSRL